MGTISLRRVAVRPAASSPVSRETIHQMTAAAMANTTNSRTIGRACSASCECRSMAALSSSRISSSPSPDWMASCTPMSDTVAKTAVSGRHHDRHRGTTSAAMAPMNASGTRTTGMCTIRGCRGMPEMVERSARIGMPGNVGAGPSVRGLPKVSVRQSQRPPR